MFSPRGYLSLVFITSILSVAMHEPTAYSDRDKEAGYWFDAVLHHYDLYTGKATFNCSLKLFKRNLRPARISQKVGGITVFDYIIPAQPGDSNSSEKITNGNDYSANVYLATNDQLLSCEMYLADGRTDRRQLQLTFKEDSPFAYLESSKYPETETIPFRKSFYLVVAYFGKVLKYGTRFSHCNPRTAGCKAEPKLENYEETKQTLFTDTNVKYYMQGKATETGYYTFFASTEAGNISLYYHLKVAEPTPASWTEETTAVKENEVLYVKAGNHLIIPCTFDAPMPYKNKVHWFQDGYYRRDYWAMKPTEYGSYYDIEKAVPKDSGLYNCTIEFLEWSKKIPSLSRKFKVKVTNGSASVVLATSAWTMILPLCTVIVEKIYRR